MSNAIAALRKLGLAKDVQADNFRDFGPVFFCMRIMWVNETQVRFEVYLRGPFELPFAPEPSAFVGVLWLNRWRQPTGIEMVVDEELENLTAEQREVLLHNLYHSVETHLPATLKMFTDPGFQTGNIGTLPCTIYDSRYFSGPLTPLTAVEKERIDLLNSDIADAIELGVDNRDFLQRANITKVWELVQYTLDQLIQRRNSTTGHRRQSLTEGLGVAVEDIGLELGMDLRLYAPFIPGYMPLH